MILKMMTHNATLTFCIIIVHKTKMCPLRMTYVVAISTCTSSSTFVSRSESQQAILVFNPVRGGPARAPG